ncbi:MAG TPA: hypothetical protein DCZ10_16000 [Pelotomaculum sp.]|nr:hypothetical protein [Pelotomaculum sp.]
MIKKALEYLVGLGEAKILDIGTGKYSDKPVTRICEPTAKAITATTLTSLVDYIRSDIDKKSSEKLIVHVISPSEVSLRSELNNDSQRDSYIICEALLPNNLRFGRFVDPEEFNIMLQSSFVDNSDKGLLLKVTGLIQEKTVKEVGDDGTSQAIVMKTGVAKVGDVIVPNPVTLAPYRTFPEIEQPESKFIFRMQSGPSAALFEADGGAWRNDAMERIKAWLEEELHGVNNIRIIS